MGIVGRVREAIGREERQQPVVYRCVTCQTTFDWTDESRPTGRLSEL